MRKLKNYAAENKTNQGQPLYVKTGRIRIRYDFKLIIFYPCQFPGLKAYHDDVTLSPGGGGEAWRS
jgi:hypothetical protein